MTLWNAAIAARSNGAAGPPAMAPLPDEMPIDLLPASEPWIALGAQAPVIEARIPVVVVKRAGHLIIGFDGVTRRLLDPAAYAALRAEARRHIEGTTRSQYEIARILDIKPSTLSYWKQREGWIRPPGAPLPPRLGPELPPGEKTEARRLRMIGRLYRVFERQTADLEARAVLPGATTDEKDARALSVLAKTLETLISLDRDDGAKATKPESVDRGDYRAELARTLSRWAEEGEESGEPS